jgi:ribonuclease D
MPTTDRPYEFIETADALESFTEREFPHLEGAPVALDIEEDREHGFNPVVALIQITVEDRDYVIDPLSIPRDVLEPAVEFICLAPSQIVMHGCRNDVTGLKRDFGVGPGAVGDTQTAARFLGRDAFGLAALLEAQFGVELDKGERRSNWLRRPLTQAQLDYAREDTRYLLPLWDTLRTDVEQAGWSDALEEECEALRDLAAERVAFDELGWRTLKGVKQLTEPDQLRVAALWRWRYETARVVDRHPSRVLAPWALLYLARTGVSGLREGSKARPRGVSEERLEQLEAWLDSPPDAPLTPPRPPRTRSRAERDIIDARVERLAAWRRSTASETGLDPGFLAPRSVLESIAAVDAEVPGDYAQDPDIRHWRVARWADDWIALR